MKQKQTIERGHLAMARPLIRKLAVEHPDEALMSVRGRALKGKKLVSYLDSLPADLLYLSDCPQRKADGTCGCFA